MKRYQYLLKEKGSKQSMSRKGNCLDNAIIENFFGILKSELFYIQKFANLKELKREIKKDINYYNEVRIKFKQNEPDTISSSLLSKSIINLYKLLGAVFKT